nr:reverse transcriptase domain-containing protein [Tanacetum cinerariifolium]
MVKYLEKAKSLISGFANFSISQILRRKSIQEEEVATVVEEEGPTWMTPIMEYLKDETLPGDRKEASKLCIKARQYELLEGVLYRRSFLNPWLRYVGPLQADYVIRKIHEGSCKRANRSLGKGIKARLDEENKNWIEELPYVLWAHRTMIKLSHGNTPFSLTYETKAVIPAEIRMPTYRTAVMNDVYNNEELRLNLDLLEERRECAAIREAKAKLKMTKYYNTRVRGVTFRHGDFFTVVMRQVMLLMEESSARSGKDPMGSPKPSETEHTG